MAELPPYIGFNRTPRPSEHSPDNYTIYKGTYVVVIGKEIRLEGMLVDVGRKNILLRVDGRTDGENNGSNSATIKLDDIKLIGPRRVILPPEKFSEAQNTK